MLSSALSGIRSARRCEHAHKLVLRRADHSHSHSSIGSLHSPLPALRPGHSGAVLPVPVSGDCAPVLVSVEVAAGGAVEGEGSSSRGPSTRGSVRITGTAVSRRGTVITGPLVTPVIAGVSVAAGLSPAPVVTALTATPTPKPASSAITTAAMPSLRLDTR